MYLWLSCPDRPFSEDLGDTEVITRVREVLVHGAVMKIDVSPVPLMEGVDNPWVNSLGPTFDCLC
jgi:hypothetical protein